MIYDKDMTRALFTTSSTYFSYCILLLTIIAVASLHSKLGRTLFHFTSSVSWFPILECLVHSISTCPPYSSSYVFFLLREPRFTYSICLFISPMLRAHTKDLWQLKNYLFVFTGLIVSLAMLAALEGTCSTSEFHVGNNSGSSANKGTFIPSIYCELAELSAPYTQMYIQSNFVYVLSIVFSLVHLTYANITYCIAFKKSTFFTYFNFNVDNIESILTEAAIKAEKDSNTKNNLPDDLKELSVADAIQLCEGKMSSERKNELRLHSNEPSKKD